MNNGDTKKVFTVGGAPVRGLGSFHKTLKHNLFGEVDEAAFNDLVTATEGDGSLFATVPKFDMGTAPLTNPQAGLAHDRLVSHPATHSMAPAPHVLSISTAAEMIELYWMALLRDTPFDKFDTDPGVATAAAEIGPRYQSAAGDHSDAGRLRHGIDLPGSAQQWAAITPGNLFRLGLPGEEIGPFVSQFFVRPVPFGTQSIDQKQVPYAKNRDYLTSFQIWLDAQNTGRDAAGNDYPKANEDAVENFEQDASQNLIQRYISTPRDLARFVNKDALHQAYFNAALLMLSGDVNWTTPGNPYYKKDGREAGFGVLGGPHLLALVSEVATRALKVVWNQKWQVHLRLRPEAYGGLVHVQNIGNAEGQMRPYGLPNWVAATEAAMRVRDQTGSLLLPMAYTPGSPTHPAYGAGHATVAGACVTILKAYFAILDAGHQPLLFKELKERGTPYGAKAPIQSYVTGVGMQGSGTLTPLPHAVAEQLTIEGELNKLAMNVAMGRSMGGVHWRSDNARSLMLGEALAARVLADITVDCNERPEFIFRTFSRDAMTGEPKIVKIRGGHVFVNGAVADTNSSSL